MIINWKKVSIRTAYVIAGLYILFLISPIVVSPILNSYSEDIATSVKTATGFDTNIEKLSFVATPNLTAGIKAKNLSMSVPAAENPFVSAYNASGRIALLPLLFRKIQIAGVSADNLTGEFVIKKDGTFLIQDFLIQEDKPSSKVQTQAALPFGFTLSNHLPNVRVKAYKLAFVDAMTSKSYGLEGETLHITDFILDKKIKISTVGKVIFEDSVISNYDIKLFNKIMPNLKLQDLVFPKEIAVEEEPAEMQFNIIDIFKTVYNNKFSADLTTDVKLTGTLKNHKINGKMKIDALTVGVDGNKLPESYLDLVFKGNRTSIDSIFFTSFDEREKTQLIGDITSGKKPSVDLTLRSNAKFNNIITLIDRIAKTFGVNDFDTLSATGGIDADFNISSDLKKVASTGYLKIPTSSVKYGLYDVLIDNITADVGMMNNNIDIHNAGFSILGHQLNIAGSIKSDSETDIKLTVDKLSLKGLLAVTGQGALLKENKFNSGDLSVLAVLKGKLNAIKPELSASVDNVDVLNISSGAKLTLKKVIFELLYDGKTAVGDFDIKDLLIAHPSVRLSVPDTNILIDTKDINIKKCYLLLNNSRIDITGAVKDFITDRMNINVLAKGNLNASDIMALLPNELSSLISGKGSLPVNVLISGSSKIQNIKSEINANPQNYVALADLDVLKNQNTKIHSNIEVIGDTLNISNTGISNDKTTVAKLSGEVTKLYSSPKLNLNIAVPNQVSFPIWGVPNSNITANGTVSVVGSALNPQMRGSINLTDISMKDMDFAISDLTADLSGEILNGHATVRQFKSGGIVATDLTGNFSLKDYSKFYLTDFSAKAFDGKVKGNMSYSIPDSKIGVEFSGNGLNSTKAVEGAVGIKNALTGVLDFDANLKMQGITDKDIINSMFGNIDFNITDGKFISIGRLGNLVAAQNVSSNSILKSAVSALSSVATVQETDKFKYIRGKMALGSGKANLSEILVAGPLMSYYVTGTYNILPNSANLIILGRLEAKVVSLLGPLGDLSAEKLLSFIPKFGTMTSNMLKQLTADPANENVALIPALTGGSATYKDFKVVFNGPVESSASVRSFKWLSTCDTTEMNLKQELENAKDAVKTNVTNRIEEAKTNVQNVKTNVNNIIETQKNKAQEVKNNFEQSKAEFQAAKENAKQNSENMKNLFQNVIKNSQTKMQTPSTPQE